jgi:type IV secretory pathway component VirB8
MKVESFNFIPFVTAIALFSVVDAFQSLKQRFDFKNLGQRTDQLTRNSIHSLQSVLENRKSDFADIDINEITKKEQSPFDYNWKQQWYAVTYDFNLPTIKDQKPLAYSVFDQELTFWRDEQGVSRK